MTQLLLDPQRIDRALERALAPSLDAIGTTHTCSAIQAAVGTLDGQRYHRAIGRTSFEPGALSVSPETPFDIASVTKALVGATLAMQAIDRGLADWHAPLCELFAPWRQHPDPRAAQVTFLQLLNHTSGLPAWHKYYLEYPLSPSPKRAEHTRRDVVARICQTPLCGDPGGIYAYSDLGYILLASVLEAIFEKPLAEVARAQIFLPLQLQHTDYVWAARGDTPLTGAAATERCELRGGVVKGSVHDENTEIIGGVSCHAGVFSTADDLLRFGLHLLAIDHGEEVDAALVSRETLHFAWSEQAAMAGGNHRGGWDTPSGATSSAGRGFLPATTVGHLGFTGTSLWLEREKGVVSVLLTNRVYPTRENARIKAARIDFQEAVLPPSPLAQNP
ncbi:beta-lactamase family protein [Lujinxingia vulgaris]|uniref:Beta-lactamase family protein n=1 Tax=Lujinxingia vulgaris TaxID=2600176 RepID=A0A5C6XM72_9DELT|nr:serine hydrolase domain-containing protein [Lujinxingia vulgaris]TXD38444.1 beta-lactamase family protein [Lujinxingia vulgaris]